MPNTHRLTGRFFSVLIFLAFALALVRSGFASSGPTLCEISDTVYRADGTPAQGDVVILWPEFTTAAGQPVAAGQLTSGKPVIATISTSGQQVQYTFAATADTNVTFNVTNFDFTDVGGPAEVFLVFYEPGSSSSYTTCDVTANTTCPLEPPVGGIWSIALVPYAGTAGSLTLTMK